MPPQYWTLTYPTSLASDNGSTILPFLAAFFPTFTCTNGQRLPSSLSTSPCSDLSRFSICSTQHFCYHPFVASLSTHYSNRILLFRYTSRATPQNSSSLSIFSNIIIHSLLCDHRYNAQVAYSPLVPRPLSFIFSVLSATTIISSYLPTTRLTQHRQPSSLRSLVFILSPSMTATPPFILEPTRLPAHKTL